MPGRAVGGEAVPTSGPFAFGSQVEVLRLRAVGSSIETGADGPPHGASARQLAQTTAAATLCSDERRLGIQRRGDLFLPSQWRLRSPIIATQLCTMVHLLYTKFVEFSTPGSRTTWGLALPHSRCRDSRHQSSFYRLVYTIRDGLALTGGTWHGAGAPTTLA